MSASVFALSSEIAFVISDFLSAFMNSSLRNPRDTLIWDHSALAPDPNHLSSCCALASQRARKKSGNRSAVPCSTDSRVIKSLSLTVRNVHHHARVFISRTTSLPKSFSPLRTAVSARNPPIRHFRCASAHVAYPKRRIREQHAQIAAIICPPSTPINAAILPCLRASRISPAAVTRTISGDAGALLPHRVDLIDRMLNGCRPG